MMVTTILRLTARGGGNVEYDWQNAKAGANKVIEELYARPFAKAIDEVLNKKVPNTNLSVPIKVAVSSGSVEEP
jgi:hypothetical protein